MLDKSVSNTEVDYFEKLARRLGRPLVLHKSPGALFKGVFSIGKSWGGVTEHCLMETGRAEVWADKLKLTEEIKEDLMTAALLHDFYKRYEIEAVNKDIQSGGSGRAGILRVDTETARILRKAGFKKNILKITQVAGAQPEALFLVESILSAGRFSDEDIACLLMYYIDAYTRGSEWVLSVESPDRRMINDLDRRVERNMKNIRYEKMDKQALEWHRGHPLLEGKTMFEAMREVGHLVEEKLAEIIKTQNNEDILPIKLPEVIDGILKEKIFKV